MPSGVSQGSALPAGIAAATGSKETSAKFGMRVILLASFVMAGLVPAIHVLFVAEARRGCPDEPGHDGLIATISQPAMSVIALPSSIMVRMLVADDAICLFRPVILQRGLARQIGDANHPAEPRFGSILPGWYDLIRPVERTGHDLDPRAVDAAEAERRATIPAKVTHGDGGGLKRRRFAAGPGKIGVLDIGEGSERRTGGLLAHPTMADADLGRQPRQ